MLFLLLLSAYLAGSIPAALITGRLLGGKDIRKEGSGNAGATNVLRLYGFKAALPVALFDFSKAFFPVFYSGDLAALLGITVPVGNYLKIILLVSVLAGHVFPVWAGFRGGKAVASAAGGVSALFPPAAPVCLAVFLLTALITRYISVASLAAAWFLPLFYLLMTNRRGGVFSFLLEIFFLVLAAGVTVLHRKNIQRLMKGEENRLGKK